MTPEEGLRLDGVTKRFGQIEVLRQISFRVNPGEILALTGPSGAGKSTTCRIISGIEQANAGEVWLGRRELSALSPQARDIAYMYESYALYPHLSVYDNVAWSLRAPSRKVKYNEMQIDGFVREVLELVELSGLEQRFPSELSGGQKQRVALCRAIVRLPVAYLLDEPISHLDAKLRHKLRAAVRHRLKSREVSTIWCTPDATEALSVADMVAILVDGRILQIGAPETVYRNPMNVGVARLIGDPSMNLLSGTLVEDGEKLTFVHQSATVRLSDPIRNRLSRVSNGHKFLLGIRPTDLVISAPEKKETSTRAEVYTFEPFGKYSIITLRMGQDLLKIKSYQQVSRLQAGDVVGIQFPDSNFILFEAESGEAI